MAEGRHDPARARTGNAALDGHEPDGAEGVAHPGIGFRFRVRDQLPVGGIGDVFKQMDRWVDGPDEAIGAAPSDAR
jgi:hypothetical protein